MDFVTSKVAHIPHQCVPSLSCSFVKYLSWIKRLLMQYRLLANGQRHVLSMRHGQVQGSDWQRHVHRLPVWQSDHEHMTDGCHCLCMSCQFLQGQFVR